MSGSLVWVVAVEAEIEAGESGPVALAQVLQLMLERELGVVKSTMLDSPRRLHPKLSSVAGPAFVSWNLLKGVVISI